MKQIILVLAILAAWAFPMEANGPREAGSSLSVARVHVLFIARC